MAKKEKQKFVRKPQYEAIAEKNGMTLSKNLLGYMFTKTIDSIRFHYDILSNHIPCAMYDGVITDADTHKVKILVEEQYMEKIDAIAENNNGKKYTPTVLNDYE